jgi:hypothetical protein
MEVMLREHPVIGKMKKALFASFHSIERFLEKLEISGLAHTHSGNVSVDRGRS